MRRLRGLNQLHVRIQNPESWVWPYQRAKFRIQSYELGRRLIWELVKVIDLTPHSWFMILDSGFSSCNGLLEQNHEHCWRQPLDQSRFEDRAWEFSKRFRQVHRSRAQRTIYPESWCDILIRYTSPQNSRQTFQPARPWIVTSRWSRIQRHKNVIPNAELVEITQIVDYLDDSLNHS